MAVPRRKTSPSRRGEAPPRGRTQEADLCRWTRIPAELRRPHHLDLKTGMYKGRQVLKPKAEA